MEEGEEQEGCARDTFFWSRVVTGSLVAPEKGWDDARHEHARDELLMTIYIGDWYDHM